MDAFNIADVLACNIKPVTVCTDLLKPGGYERMAQYFENIDSRMEGLCASNYRELVLKTAGESDLKKALVKNLGSYRDRVLGNRHYHQNVRIFNLHEFMHIRNMHQHGWCLISHILGQDHCSQMRLSVSNEYVRF